MAYLALISLVLGAVRFVSWIYTTVWGKEARLDAKIAYLEAEKARAKAERDRLEEKYQDIQDQPEKTQETIRDALNDEWNKKS
jgi:cell division protein FtsB